MRPENSTTDLPAEVIAAIQAGRKIEAIKLLREAEGLGLKESKNAVEAYIRSNPSLQQPQSKSNVFLTIVFLLLLGYVGYQLLK